MASRTYFTCTLGDAIDISGKFKTINELLEKQSEINSDLPVIGFYRPKDANSDDEQYDCHVLTFEDVFRGVLVTADILSHQFQQENIPTRSTIALLSASSPEFLFTWLACIWLGHPVLLIAPECSAQGIAHLCDSCEVEILITDKKNSQLGGLATQSSGPMPKVKLQKSPFHDLDVFEVIARKPTRKLPSATIHDTDVAYLHHTSGTSSGKPKPIPQAHRGALGVLPALDGKSSATFTTTPLYHGGPADIFRAWTSDAMIWLFPSDRMPTVPANIARCLVSTEKFILRKSGPQILYFASVPYILQMMTKDDTSLTHLRRMDMVSVGGAALAKEVGDTLVQNDVRLVSRFGSVECGFLLSSDRDYANDKEWQYLRAPKSSPCLRFEPREGGLFELVVLKDWPHLAKTNRDDGSYATADLFEQHPSIPDAWRYHSRSDSQLTLVTGKKFDPAPLEDSTVAGCPAISEALIFGNDRPYPGILVFRCQADAEITDENLVSKLWQVVDKLNQENQKHARITKSMIIPMPYEAQPLEKSSKGTVLRGKAEQRYAEDIAKAYSQSNAEDCEFVADEDLPQRVKQIVSETMSDKADLLESNTDLFSLGVDSVAGIQIRHRLQGLLGDHDNALPLTIVDDCGSVDELIQYIRRVRAGQKMEDKSLEQAQAEMKRMVEQYSNFVPSTAAKSAESSIDATENMKRTILLTGATGLLGSHVLSLLARDASVEKVFCLVRGSCADGAHGRVNQSLRDRQLPSLQKSCSIVVLCGEAGKHHLGLNDQIYHEISETVTHIIHLAWPVNFRMKLSSFEESIAGVHNLLSFAIASSRTEAPRFIFCSSVASVMASKAHVIPETISDDLSSATNLGYSQSKWVAEQICVSAAQTTRLKDKISILRVGQLSGNTKTGTWNMKEAWPTLLSTVKLTGVLPDLPGEVLDWLPVDIAAEAVVGSSLQPTPSHIIYHLVNGDSPTTWRQMLEWLHEDVAFETVPPSKWLESLDKVSARGESHPALALLELWRSAYQVSDDKQAPRKGFATENTREALPASHQLAPVSRPYFQKLWLWINTQS